MKQYCLKVTSKNEKSIKIFLHFFFTHLNTKFNIIPKSITPYNNQKIITLLKSPHVNKTAQEHLETRLFTKKILVNGICLRKNIIFLKKILDKLFQDISIQLEFTINKNINTINKLLIFYPNNFSLTLKKEFKTNLKRNKQKIISKNFKLKKNSLINLKKLLYIISTFGEIILISSVK